ncbi:PAS domain S-box protein [Azospirillum brasilense]|uniref:Sensor protein FixL n=2 Tax=Azospirillum brasilense TaxID=192 RepID=A0A0P0EE72_AZOBR|nr:histidine kinase [Azospirillum brasilense]PWC97106.1 histidine kinase [Azospirillum sp. Sp 7]OPH14711.1 histidine kinase [Azospirillum brasilense]OPH22769.1 histidine kinase [Azospirillum brasilense]QCO11174.1 hybrid sensor histidine kinase/response regulator [Azospirillum brasilense]
MTLSPEERRRPIRRLTWRVRPKRVRSWLVLLVMAVAVPLVLFSVFLLIRNVDAQAQQTEQLVLDRTRLLAEDVEREVSRQIAAAEVLSTSESLTTDDLAAFYRQAIGVRDRLGSNVVLRDPQGRQRVNSRVPWGTELPGSTVLEADQRVFDTGRPQVTGLFIGDVSQSPILAVIAPVIRDGQIRYLLSLNISQERLQAIVSPERIPAGWRAGVIDQDGVVIARSHLSEQFVGKRLPAALWAGMQEQPDGIHRATNLEKVEAIQAYSRSRSFGWVVAMSVPTTLVASPARHALLLFTGGGLVLLLIGIGAAVLLGRRLTRSVSQLAGAAEALGAGYPVPPPNGGVAEIEAVGRAIRRAADLIRRREAALAESEARHRAIVQTAVDAMLVIDATGTIESFNPAAERIFGYEAGEAIGRNIRILMPEPYHSAHDGYLQAYERTGEKKIIGIGREVEGRHKDGSIFPIELAVTEWTAGERRYFTGIVRNITERRRTEDALRASKAEADRANVAKSKFLAAASHDLRQPVQAMMLFQSALAARLDGHPAGPLLDSMGQAMDGLRMLLDSLLDVSKLDAGLIVPQLQDLPIGPIIEQLGTEYHPQAEAKGLRLRVVPCALTVRSDPALLMRILRNLVENALRYTEQGGLLIGCRRRGDRLRIEVMDSGIGIPSDKHGEIFEEFFQVSNQERDRSKGLGLGLAVVRRLARLLGHKVHLRSRLGAGSAFCVDVPLIARHATRSEPVEARLATSDGRGMILVIDDEPLIRLGLQAMLEGWGYRVLTAGSIEDAVQHVESGEWPSAILADYRLRDGKTGLDAIRAVCERLRTPVPATIITGDTAPERLAEARAGGHTLLHKPIAAHELRNAVVEMVPAAD